MKPYVISDALKRAESFHRQEALQYNLTLLKKKESLLELKERQAVLYQDIAKVLLSEAPDLSEMSTIHRLIVDLKSQYAMLQSRLNELTENIAVNNAAHEKLLAEAKVLEEELAQRLEHHGDYQERLTKMANAEVQVTAMQQLYDRVYAEYHDKIPAYKQDPRYVYLVKRGFGTPDYKSSGVIRNLDHWLARQVNFTNNQNNQLMLVALLTEATQRFDNARADQEQLARIQQQCLQEEETAIGLTKIYADLEVLRTTLADYQSQSEHLLLEIQQNKEGTGSRFILTANKLANIMERLPISQIRMLTTKTQSVEDDRLLYELGSLTEAINTLISEEQQFESQYTQAMKYQQSVADINSLFRVNGLGHSGYAYNVSSSKLTKLINEVTQGVIAPQAFIQMLLRARYHDEPVLPTILDALGSGNTSVHRHTTWSRGSTRSSRFPGSGHSSSGRSSGGGGSFKTTDSF